MEILQYWKVIRKRLWLIVLLVVLAGVSAAIYSSQQVSRYSTTATLFINPGQVSPILPGEVAARNVASLVNSYSELMRTRSFVQRVVEEMDDEVSAGEVRSAISTNYVADTQFFRISATHTDPETAQEIANTAAEVLISREVQRQQAQQAQIAAQRDLESAEVEQLNTLIDSLTSEISYYDERIENVQQQIAELENTEQTSQTNARLESLYLSLPELRYARIDVQTRLADAEGRLADLRGVNVAPPVDTAVIVDAALVPTTPIPRQDVQRVLLAMSVALVIGVTLSFLLEYLDYTVKTPEELDAVYGVHTQGVIGVTESKHLKKKGSSLVALFNTNSPIAESFRAIRTGLQVTSLNTSLRSLLVTSAGPGEGKTFVAANLAASLALGGSRVILVDTDLRKPRIHHVFELDRGTGFTNLVVNQENTLAATIQDTPIKNLKVLTCGTIPPNPSELLSSVRAEDVMKQLSDQADIVIYDSPPAATVTDAAIIAQRVDGVIQVVWAGHTRINLVLRCKTVLEQVGANILGPILNQVNLPDLGYYSYYYQYGYYQTTNGNSKEASVISRIFSDPKKSRRRVNGYTVVDQQTSKPEEMASEATNGALTGEHRDESERSS